MENVRRSYKFYISLFGLCALIFITAIGVCGFAGRISYLKALLGVSGEQNKIIEKKASDLERLAENQVRLNELSSMLDAENSKIILYSELPEFFIGMNDYMGKLGIDEEVFRIGAEQRLDMDGVLKTPLVVSGFGDYQSVRSYISKLSYYGLNELHISSEALKKEGHVHFIAYLDIYSIEDAGVGKDREYLPGYIKNPFYYGKNAKENID